MRVSLNWLRKYVDWSSPPEELASKLTMAGLEVESIDRLGSKYDRFVVGQVLDVSKHPNADKLTVCNLATKKERLKIVCGAPNVKAGQKVAVGLVGATIPRNQHDPEGKPFVLERAKIRGVESEGMICSEYELGTGSDAEGILILDPNAKVGMPLAAYFGLTDTLFEIGVSPNRPDCLGHLGVAREISAIFGKKLKKPKVNLKESRVSTKEFASVKIEDVDACPRYTARILLGVKVGYSPKWLQDLLKVVGVRPVNSVVDVTNYVLLELGQPLHAFDYDKLEGHKIIVKTARMGEQFTTLDGKQRKLRSDSLLICDGSRAVAIAGVMGGANTEISVNTRNVLIESAYFNPQSIRRTSKFLGLSTDASQRFERGADPSITMYAADRCIQLMQEICGGEVLKDAIDVYPKKFLPAKIRLRVERVNEVLGTNLKANEVIHHLSTLEIASASTHKKDSSSITFTAPTFRPDLKREIDLIEEVARTYGYDKIETKSATSLKFLSNTPPSDIIQMIREYLVGQGYTEIITNSMQNKSIASFGGTNPVQVLNPISEDMAALRTSLIPGLLEVIRHNIYRGTENLRVFELGNVFRKTDGSEKGKFFENYIEEERLIVALTGPAHAPGWDTPDRSVDIFDLKGAMHTLLSQIFLDKNKYICYPTTNTSSDLLLVIEINSSYAGHLRKVSSDTMKEFGIEQDVYLAEVSLEAVIQGAGRGKGYVAVPKFPPVRRDLAFVVDAATPAADIERGIRESAGELLESVKMFDLYVGEQIQQGKKSCAFSLEFLSRERTLTEDEVDRSTQNIVLHLRRKLNAELRG